MSLKKLFREFNYQEIFIYSSYIAIIIVSIIASILDYSIDSNDFFIDVISVLIVLLLFLYVYQKRDIEMASILLFWIASIFIFIYLFINSVDYSLIFAILIPLIAFIGLPLKKAILNLAFFYIYLIGIMLYFYYKHPNHTILNNKAFLVIYFISNLYMLIYGFIYKYSIIDYLNRLESSNQRNAILLKELHHRVKNNLNLISSILGLQRDKIKSKDAKDALSDSINRIEAMALLHNILYKSKSVDLQEYIDKLISYIIFSESLDMSRFHIKTDIEPINEEMNDLVELGIIINELITNSIKHNKEEVVKISIEFKKKSDFYIFNYCENVKNVNLNEVKSGFGFYLISLSVKQYKGRVEVSTKENLCYEIELKV